MAIDNADNKPNWDEYPYFRVNDNEIIRMINEVMADLINTRYLNVPISHGVIERDYGLEPIGLLENKVYKVSLSGFIYPAPFSLQDYIENSTSAANYSDGLFVTDSNRNAFMGVWEFINETYDESQLIFNIVQPPQLPDTQCYLVDVNKAGYNNIFSEYTLTDDDYNNYYFTSDNRLTILNNSQVYYIRDIRMPNISIPIKDYYGDVPRTLVTGNTRGKRFTAMRYLAWFNNLSNGQRRLVEVVIDPITLLTNLPGSEYNSRKSLIWKMKFYGNNPNYYKIISYKNEPTTYGDGQNDYGADSNNPHSTILMVKKDFVHYIYNLFHQPFTINDDNSAINTPIDELPDYDPIDSSGQPFDDGEGDFNSFSEEIDFPPIPNYNIFNSGMFKAYKLNDELMSRVANYMWSSEFLDIVSKLFSDPAETIVVLASLPISPTAGTINKIKFGNTESEIEAPVINDQFQIFDFGNLTISHFFGTYADYEGYSDIQIYLPYLGIKTININDVMNSTISLKYYIDLYSGDTIAYLKVKNLNINSVIYTFTGNILTHLPISSTNYSNLIINGMRSLYMIGNNPAIGALSAINSNMSITPKIDSAYSNGGSMSIPRPYIILRRQIIKSNSNQPLFDNVNQSGLQKGLNVINRVLSFDTSRMLNNEYEQLLQLLKKGVIYE